MTPRLARPYNRHAVTASCVTHHQYPAVFIVVPGALCPGGESSAYTPAMSVLVLVGNLFSRTRLERVRRTLLSRLPCGDYFRWAYHGGRPTGFRGLLTYKARSAGRCSGNGVPAINSKP